LIEATLLRENGQKTPLRCRFAGSINQLDYGFHTSPLLAFCLTQERRGYLLNSKRRKLPPYPALVERLRRDLSITQTSLAQRLKVSAMSVSRWERGVQEPSSQMFVKLGTLATGEMRWQFWELAGLQRTYVEGAAAHQIVIEDPSDLHRKAAHAAIVPIPLLDARIGASLFGDFISGSDVLEILTAPSEWCPHPRKTLAAFVDGNSMEPVIRDGSVICFDTSETTAAEVYGNIVVAQHPKYGSKVAWLDKTGERQYSFRSEHPDAPPMDLEGEWKLLGRLLWWTTRTKAS
jgi:phage repressor protein C with HTH and peptisase S24 domain